jgi:hypothetical protein
VSNWINLGALWRILLVGLLAGAGLPALFAVGIRALASGPQTATAGADDDRVIGGSRAGLVAAVFCFAVVLAAIGYGIYLIVSSS